MRRHAPWLVLSVLACGPSVGAGDGTTAATTDPTLTSNAEVTNSSPAGDDGVDDTSGTTGTPPMPTDCVEGTLVDDRVRIDGSGADERASLQDITVIDGDLVVTGSAETDLSMLACVREITGSLYLYDNDQLVDTDGLYWLQRLGGDLVVAGNDALVDFTGLAQVTEIEQEDGNPAYVQAHSVVIVGNASLQHVSGLASLQSIRGTLLIRDNPALLDIDPLVGLATLAGPLAINHNPSLCMSSVTAVGQGLTTYDEARSSTLANDEGC
jgi:hypothetical protein